MTTCGQTAFGWSHGDYTYRRAFTLIELLVVILIIRHLPACSFPPCHGQSPGKGGSMHQQPPTKSDSPM